jgi:hypothetical protein
MASIKNLFFSRPSRKIHHRENVYKTQAQKFSKNVEAALTFQGLTYLLHVAESFLRS